MAFDISMIKATYDRLASCVEAARKATNKPESINCVMNPSLSQTNMLNKGEVKQLLDQWETPMLKIKGM